MKTCADIGRRIEVLAGVRPEAMPEDVREHVAGCLACARALAAARLTRGLLAAAAEAPEPREGFAGRVMAALPAALAGRRGEEDVWGPAWGLLPAFAATAAALLLVFQLQARGLPDPGWPDADALLASVLEEAGR